MRKCSLPNERKHTGLLAWCRHAAVPIGETHIPMNWYCPHVLAEVKNESDLVIILFRLV